MSSNSFMAKGRVVIDDFLSEDRRDNICNLLTHIDGIVPNKEDINKALKFPGLTATIHVVFTDEAVRNIFVDMNDSEYLVYVEDSNNQN